jgi:hypothetical protein
MDVAVAEDLAICDSDADRRHVVLLRTSTAVFWFVALARSRMIESGFPSVRSERAERQSDSLERECARRTIEPGR